MFVLNLLLLVPLQEEMGGGERLVFLLNHGLYCLLGD
jgi:hypothetical protein